ncbi:MAG: response regulator transcription factor [Deltaproteobacteria bacterium]|nr:MAG: response regulator transcription factor [Deltaproteobacteria bacterium]
MIGGKGRMEKKKILIVDDDKVLLEIAKDVLVGEGYSVFTSDQSLGTSQNVAKIKPHLIIMDVNMPGLRGDKICKILKESTINKEMKIMLHSIKDDDELRRLVAESEADDFLKKSSDPKKLIEKVKSLLK